ncbi:nuclear transport factor 2 family protein [Parvularcula lutaonensis]|uniref:Nuclear transport factor 2 family protein n=1 Tax=Parvularcula lutaonensis TaxID=491923 RepID=A0ABV7M7J8_9PROT|nr:nuclear transport factor 2 family protein [Parvularcula lutaonensis]GGY42409.1 hypothetical protein GCM10007148_08830 [Parvularcula lutaonensis]
MSTEEAVRAYYRDRLLNDPEVLRSWFTRDAQVSINGSDALFGLDNTFGMKDGASAQAFTNFLVNTWKLLDFEILSLVSEGNRAATRVIVEVECIPTGLKGRSEICNHFTFDGERMTSILEFLDTAHAAKLLEGAESFPAAYAGQEA